MALQRALRCVFATVVAILAVATAASSAHEEPPAAPRAAGRGEDLFDEIFRRGAPVEQSLKTVSASFVETTTSTLLEAPQVARGTLVGRRPNQLRLVYAGADARTIVVNGNALALDWPARRLTEARDISGMMRRAERFLVMKSPADLRRHFDVAAVEASDRAGAWKVTFTPKRSQMREGVSKVHVWIDRASLVMRALQMDYPGGDTRLMEFSDVRINPPVDPGAFDSAARH